MVDSRTHLIACSDAEHRAERLAKRRREATPLDSPLERRVRLVLHGWAMTSALHKLDACIDRIAHHSAKPGAKRSDAQRGAALTEARFSDPNSRVV
jgi:hypothetical protein